MPAKGRTKGTKCPNTYIYQQLQADGNWKDLGTPFTGDYLAVPAPEGVDATGGEVRLSAKKWQGSIEVKTTVKIKKN